MPLAPPPDIDPVPYDGGPVVCAVRTFDRDSLVARGLWGGLLACETDEDYTAVCADLEPVRLRCVPELDLGPAPIWIGHMRAPALSAGV